MAVCELNRIDPLTMLKVHELILKFELGARLFRVVQRVRWGVGNTALE